MAIRELGLKIVIGSEEGTSPVLTPRNDLTDELIQMMERSHNGVGQSIDLPDDICGAALWNPSQNCLDNILDGEHRSRDGLHLQLCESPYWSNGGEEAQSPKADTNDEADNSLREGKEILDRLEANKFEETKTSTKRSAVTSEEPENDKQWEELGVLVAHSQAQLHREQLNKLLKYNLDVDRIAEETLECSMRQYPIMLDIVMKLRGLFFERIKKFARYFRKDYEIKVKIIEETARVEKSKYVFSKIRQVRKSLLMSTMFKLQMNSKLIDKVSRISVNRKESSFDDEFSIDRFTGPMIGKQPRNHFVQKMASSILHRNKLSNSHRESQEVDDKQSIECKTTKIFRPPSPIRLRPQMSCKDYNFHKSQKDNSVQRVESNIQESNIVAVKMLSTSRSRSKRNSIKYENLRKAFDKLELIRKLLTRRSKALAIENLKALAKHSTNSLKQSACTIQNPRVSTGLSSIRNEIEGSIGAPSSPQRMNRNQQFFPPRVVIAMSDVVFIQPKLTARSSHLNTASVRKELKKHPQGKSSSITVNLFNSTLDGRAQNSSLASGSTISHKGDLKKAANPTVLDPTHCTSVLNSDKKTDTYYFRDFEKGSSKCIQDSQLSGAIKKNLSSFDRKGNKGVSSSERKEPIKEVSALGAILHGRSNFS